MPDKIYFCIVRTKTSGILYLIPRPLAYVADPSTMSGRVQEIVKTLDGIVAESKKSALAFLRQIGPSAPPSRPIPIRLLNEHTPPANLKDLVAPIEQGERWGLMSDAGSPAVADPGSALVRLAHEKGIRVSPESGPSSILMALMASGLNGQRFIFHGYLSRDGSLRRRQLRDLELDSIKQDRTQIWMETPYRNCAMFEDMLSVLNDPSMVCVASDLSFPTEEIATKSIRHWKNGPRPDLKNRPSIFLLGR